LAEPEAGYSPGVRIAALLSIVAVLSPVAAAASNRAAHVAVLSLSPVTVRGTSFRSNERVRVTVSAKSTRTNTVTANARGNLSTKFRGLKIGYCDPYTVRARGNRGSSAFLKVLPECAPSGPSGEPDPGLPSDPIPKKR
jgi:hypothetical protein